MASLALLLAPLPSVLNFDGQSSSSILFDNSARLTATCGSTAPPAGPPAISRIAPEVFAPANPGDFVKLRLSNVAHSCARTAGGVPCAAKFDEIDLPKWFCVWNNSKHAEVTGPQHGYLQITGDTTLAEVHGGCASTCNSTITPYLDCPLPTVAPFTDAGGDSELSLDVYYGAAPPNPFASHVPFAGMPSRTRSWSGRRHRRRRRPRHRPPRRRRHRPHPHRHPACRLRRPRRLRLPPSAFRTASRTIAARARSVCGRRSSRGTMSAPSRAAGTPTA